MLRVCDLVLTQDTSRQPTEILVFLRHPHVPEPSSYEHFSQSAFRLPHLILRRACALHR
jgi:hypothetical protein